MALDVGRRSITRSNRPSTRRLPCTEGFVQGLKHWASKLSCNSSLSLSPKIPLNRKLDLRFGKLNPPLLCMYYGRQHTAPSTRSFPSTLYHYLQACWIATPFLYHSCLLIPFTAFVFGPIHQAHVRRVSHPIIRSSCLCPTPLFFLASCTPYLYPIARGTLEYAYWPCAMCDDST